MTSPLQVAPHEQGMIRVFALSLTPPEAEALRDSAPAQAKLLGVETINISFTEVFPVADTETLGLAGYLIEGNDVDPASIAPDRARLAALDGWVLLVYSRAFDGAAQTLSPAPALTLIGCYTQPGTDWSESQTLRSDSAKPQGGTARKRPSDAAMSGRIAMAALLVITALTALMVWIAA